MGNLQKKICWIIITREYLLINFKKLFLGAHIDRNCKSNLLEFTNMKWNFSLNLFWKSTLAEGACRCFQELGNILFFATPHLNQIRALRRSTWKQPDAVVLRNVVKVFRRVQFFGTPFMLELMLSFEINKDEMSF